MGVRGLTTFIAANADKYLQPHELHDTHLVIDGNNLAAHLYKWHAKCYDCFGGDYDKYAKTVTDFFKLLQDCNVVPLVILDGGYEQRKLRTVYARLRTRVKQAKHLTCATEGSESVFPLFLRDLFVEIVSKLRLKVARCAFEADYELACIARQLRCPLLSYDSDFYIFDVLYIPFSTVNMTGKTSRVGYKFVECEVYKIENFLQSFGGLQSESVPLLAVLLGNDYIEASVFKSFWEQLKLQKRKCGETDRQRRIATIIRWLQCETYESAVAKILGRIKLVHRNVVADQIKTITEGYLCAESEVIRYLRNVGSDTDPSKLDVKTQCGGQSEGTSRENSETPREDEVRANLKSGFGSGYRNIQNMPRSFEENYKKCEYPASFVDILLNNRYFFTPQLENHLNEPSHNISLKIVAAIFTILSYHSTKSLTYVLRNRNASVTNFALEKSAKELPSFENLRHITLDEGLNCLLRVLEVQIDVNVLNEFPDSWRLFILSVIYWTQNVTPNVTKCHVYSIVLSAIALKLVNIGHYRVEDKFLSKYRKEIEDLIKVKPPMSDDIKDVKTAFSSVTENDCIILMKEVISYFQMDIKLRKNPKLFDINIIDAFAQFQSCALHIKYLNKLLNKPFEDYLISDFYNGTLIYNLCVNFMSRSNLDSYIHLLLQHCPNILQCFSTTTHLVVSVLPPSTLKPSICKRKRKKKAKENFFLVENHASSDEDIMCDANNKYAVLSSLN